MTTPQQPGPYPQQPAGAYGQQPPPAGAFAAGGTRPGVLTGAAVLALIVGGLSIIFALIGFSWLALVGGIYSIYIILALIAGAGLIWGGIQALNGKDGKILVMAAGGAIVVNLIGMIMYFTASSLISLIIPALILVLMFNPQSKAWITSRGGRVF